jgi:protein SCO1/2
MLSFHTMRTLLRFTLFAALLCLAGCGPEKPWHSTDITGGMPDLSFRMVRASDGLKVSADDYRGRVVLLYFGYTHCPDVCPTTLANISDVLKRLGRDAEKVRVLFVSVDPDRDTLDVLKQYAEAFGQQVDGLRGSDNAIADLARRYRVAYTVKKMPDYVVTHTSAVFVFDARGRARLVTTDTNDTAGLTDDVRRLATE